MVRELLILFRCLVVNLHLHHHFFNFKPQPLYLLVSLLHFPFESIDAAFQLLSDFVILEVPDPVENVLFCFFFKHILLENLVLFLEAT